MALDQESRWSAHSRSSTALPAATVHGAWIIMSALLAMLTVSPAMAIRLAML
jgi:hypothetical protein